MKKNIIIIIFIFCCMILTTNSVDYSEYLGWIFRGSGETPSAFPKTEENYSITEVVCTSSSARWDYNKKKVAISPSTSTTGCNIIVGDKQDPPPTTETYENALGNIEEEIEICTTKKETQSDYKELIINAIVAASGNIDTSDESILSYEYLGNFISKSLYVYPTSVSKQESEILQQKSTSGTTTFAVPFKTVPSYTKSVSNQYSGMNCSGSVSSVTRFGYNWSLSNSSNRNGTCYLNITFKQP